jgi:hypothetical protein
MPRNHKPKKPIKPMKLDISDEMIAERRGGSGPMPRACLNGWHLQLQKLIYLVNG